MTTPISNRASISVDIKIAPLFSRRICLQFEAMVIGIDRDTVDIVTTNLNNIEAVDWAVWITGRKQVDAKLITAPLFNSLMVEMFVLDE